MLEKGETREKIKIVVVRERVRGQGRNDYLFYVFLLP